jgi:Tol biopolymer transport system component
VTTLDGSKKKILQTAIRSAIFVDPAGSLLWSHNGQLFSRPFDFGRLEFTGPPKLVQDELQPFSQRHELPLDISANGVLAFQNGSDESVIAKVSLEDGSREDLLPPDRYRNPRLSPDGRHIAFELQRSSDERLIWVEDLQRGTQTLISERGALADSPVWSPDGEFVYFGSSVSGEWNTYRKRVYGGGSPELVGRPEGATDLGVLDLTADGRWLLVSSNPSDGWDFYLGEVDGAEASWQPWLVAPSNESTGRFSADGSWVAYQSDLSGQEEVYVAPREGGPSAQRILVSVNGGTDPGWSRDGTKLFYRDPAGTLMEVAVRRDGDRLDLAPPVKHFELIPPNVGYLRNTFDAHPDGESLIAFLHTGGQVPSIRIRTGWR